MSAAGSVARALRWSLFGLGLLLAYPLGLALLAALQAPLSWPSRARLGGLLLVEAALLGLPLRRPRRVALLGVIGAALVVTGQLPRTCAPPEGVLIASARADAGPASVDAAPPAPAWLREERDLVLLAAEILPGTRWLEPGEAAGLRAALAAGYDALLAEPGDLRPGASTWRGRQQPGRVDALEVRSARGRPEIGLLFLHGFGGSFAWPCWAAARAARARAAITLCPSLGQAGDWWSARGHAVAQQAVDALRARGVERYVLMGLSNGAVGAAALASALHPAPAGLILIAGLPRGATPDALPTLVVQGDVDRRVSAARARRLAQQRAPTWAHVELAGDHFAWLRRPREVDAAIARWWSALDDADAGRAP